MSDNDPEDFWWWWCVVVGAVLIVTAVAWRDFYMLRVIDAFRDADPAVTLEQVWDALTCSPECRIDYPREE